MDKKTAPEKKSDKNCFTIYVTKYAFSSGVYSDVVSQCDTLGMVRSETTNGYYYHKPHYHHTEEEARAQVAKMKAAKIRSVKKQLAKLEAYEFSVKDRTQ